MNTLRNQVQRTKDVTTMVPGRRKPATERMPASKPFVVLNIIEKTIQSQLSETYRDGQGYGAAFMIETSLREYVRLQGQAWGEKRRLSSIISFTSADSYVDALALPTSDYVAETWRKEGIKLLRLIERALYDSGGRASGREF